jgi:hypothetical protein
MGMDGIGCHLFFIWTGCALDGELSASTGCECVASLSGLESQRDRIKWSLI